VDVSATALVLFSDLPCGGKTIVSALKPKTTISPHLQVWVTAVALVVGFLCGLAVSYIGFRPSLDALRDARRLLGRSGQELEDHRLSERRDRDLLRALAAEDPALFRRVVGRYEPPARRHFEEISGPPKVTEGGTGPITNTIAPATTTTTTTTTMPDRR
jgi:hypothetical protein